MEQIVETRSIDVPSGKLREWWHLAYRRVWNQYLSAACAPEVKLREMLLTGIAVSARNLDVPLSITVTPKADCHALIEVAVPPRNSEAVGVYLANVIPEGRRRTPPPTWSSPRPGCSNPENDEAEIAKLLRKIADTLQGAATSLSEAQCEYLVTIPIEVDNNWPVGRFQFGSRFTFCFKNEPLSTRLALVGRIVKASSAEECLAVHQPGLVLDLGLLNVLIGRWMVPLLWDVDRAQSSEPSIIALAGAELLKNSEVWSRAATLPMVEVYDPYSTPQDIRRLHRFPNDLADLFASYDALEQTKRDVLDRALAAFLAGLKISDWMPTLAMTAFWTSLEALITWDSSVSTHESTPCPHCRQPKSRTQDAILDRMQSALRFSDEVRARVAEILKRVRRDWRIAWVHKGQLTGSDLAKPRAIWFAHTDKQVPGWAQTEALMHEMEDFARKTMLELLKGEVGTQQFKEVC